MQIDQIRKKTIEELKTELRELLREQFNLRMQKSFSENVRPHSFKMVRRNIARVKTIMREKAGEL